MRIFYFWCGFMAAVTLLMACANTFPYKWWTMDIENGRLIDPDGKGDDRPLEFCKRDVAGDLVCIAMTIDEIYRLKDDYETMAEELKKCKN